MREAWLSDFKQIAVRRDYGIGGTAGSDSKPNASKSDVLVLGCRLYPGIILRRTYRIDVNRSPRHGALTGFDNHISALDEHTEWILMHRDRSIDQSEIWRIGS